jgi:hypothetical protein
MAGMSVAIAPSDVRWVLVADLFDPPGQRGAPAPRRHRAMVDGMGRTGIQWRYLPGPPPNVDRGWSQRRRLRANGVSAAAVACLAAIVR